MGLKWQHGIIELSVKERENSTELLFLGDPEHIVLQSVTLSLY